MSIIITINIILKNNYKLFLIINYILKIKDKLTSNDEKLALRMKRGNVNIYLFIITNLIQFINCFL